MREKIEGTVTLLCYERKRKAIGSGVFGDFFVEVGEGGFEGFFVVRICGVGEVGGDADARQLQVFYGLFAQALLGALFVLIGGCFPGFGGSHLSFHVLTFPTSGHDLLSHRE
jgi:hypothetical protein